MRVTSFPLATLRDSPAEAEIISHQLLLKGGFVRRVSAGIYAYMPLLQKVLDKISIIIDQELRIINCSKLLLPQLHPAELWKKSERWEGYTAGEGIMFHLKDRQKKEFGLAPTHEEVITRIASEIISSYKQLPICLYQIQTKFRDEIRPRFGLMRSREFIMKDAYSFHKSEADLRDFYGIMENTYKNIFKNCGLKTVGVDADSGSIGGAASKEFMITAESGEDSILFTESGSYAANLEKAVSIQTEAKPLKERNEIYLKTSNQKSIIEVCQKNDLDPSQIVKVVTYVGKLENKKEIPILVSIRGDQSINEVKLFNLLTKNYNSSLISLSLLDKETNSGENSSQIPFGYLGPDLEDDFIKNKKNFEEKWFRVVDLSAFELSNFISGANKIDYHKFFKSWDIVKQPFIRCDVRNAKEGDYVSNDSNEMLIEKRGIEIGHIFQLGQKYSEKLNAKFSNKEGNLENIWMGCYGIGVTRLAQAAIEQNHDNEGICWPIQIAPFEVVLIPTNIKDMHQKELSEEIYTQFLKNNIDILFDDRDERAGVKFKDSDLIGIPFRIVIGRDSINKEVELISRTQKNKVKVSSEDILEKFLYESKLMYN